MCLFLGCTKGSCENKLYLKISFILLPLLMVLAILTHYFLCTDCKEIFIISDKKTLGQTGGVGQNTND